MGLYFCSEETIGIRHANMEIADDIYIDVPHQEIEFLPVGQKFVGRPGYMWKVQSVEGKIVANIFRRVEL